MSEQIIYKMATDLTVEDGKREIVAVISASTVDAEGDVVLPQGLQKADYSGMPIYFNHQYAFKTDALPIGSVKWIKPGNHQGIPSIISKGSISEGTQNARDVFNLLQDKSIKGVSIGFTPIKTAKPTAQELVQFPGAKQIIHSWKLKEWSIAPLQCNQQAVALMVSKGYSQERIDALMEKAVIEEITEEVNDSEKHEGSSAKKPVKTLTVTEIKNIIAKRIDNSWIKIDTDSLVKRILSQF